jgi:hypothetical protein
MLIGELRNYRLVGEFEHFGLFIEFVSECYMKEITVQFHDSVSLNDEGIFPITMYNREKNESTVLNNWREVQKKVIELSKKEQFIKGWFVTYAMGEDYQAHKNFQTINGKNTCVIITRDNVYVYDIDGNGTLADREDYFLNKVYQKFDHYIPLFKEAKTRKDATPTDFAKELFSSEILEELKESWVNRRQFEY